MGAATETKIESTNEGAAEGGGASADAGGGGDEDFAAAARAAVKAAHAKASADGGGDEGGDDAGDEKPAAKGKPSSLAESDARAAGAAAEGDDDEPKLAKLLRGRENKQKARVDSDGYAAKRKAEADAYYADMKKRADAEYQEMVRRASEDGRKRIDELLSPDAIQARQADANDPIVQMRKELADNSAKLQAQIEENAQWRKMQEEKEQREREQIGRQRKDYAERVFLAAADEEKFPAARALWTDRELLDQAHRVIREVAEAAQDSDEPIACDDADVMAYLEREALKRLRERSPKLSKLLQQAAELQGAEKAASPPRSTGKSRTLSPQLASERRASPKAPEEMSEKELEKAMRGAAKKHLRPDD